MKPARNPIVAEDLAEIAGDSALDFSQLRGKTILISGAGGFLPAYMAETILYLNETRGLGAKVIGLVRSRAKAEKRFAHYLGREDFRIETQNIYEKLEIAGAVDFVVHAASQASPKFYGVDPAGTLAPNVVGTYRLLELAREKKSQGFFYFSSSEVYGQPAGEAPLTEKSFGPADPLQVRACYSESKRMGETMCIAWAHQHQVPVKVVRPFHTYGPGMAADDGRVFADFVADIVAGRNIVMKSDGTAVRAYCYLADATRAFFAVLLKGGASEAYNVGNEDAAVSVVDLAEKLVRLFPERGLKVERFSDPRGQSYLASAVNRLCPDTAKLRALGWSPRHSLESGFQRTVRSYL